MAVAKIGNKSKKQAIAVGRLDKGSLNAKIYNWLEIEGFLKKGGLSDYKLWNNAK